MTSLLALRGFRTTFRMTPRSTTSRSAAVNSRVSSGLMKRDERLLEHLVLAEAEQLRDGIVRLQDLAFEIGDEYRVGRVRDDDVGIQRAVPFAPTVIVDQTRLCIGFQPSRHIDLPRIACGL